MTDSSNTRTAAGLLVVLGLIVLAASCSSPPIRHYQPEVYAKHLTQADQTAENVVLAVQDFSAGAAYDEQRIVYRKGRYRFDYYHYHRWAAPPGMLVADLLRQVYAGTDAFQAVVGGYSSGADAVLSGQVIALEEVDVNKEKWLGRVVLDLHLRDAHTGELLWNEIVKQEHTMTRQSPTGLTAALSAAITKIGSETAGTLARLARESKKTRPGGNPDIQLKKPSSGEDKD
jgi:ABC-type uncharacterized transport system auxiliary subunit